VGCSTGINGEWLRKHKSIQFLMGLELDTQMAKIAEENFDKVIIGNIEELDFENIFGDKKFDFILLGDILEHLIDPWTITKKLAGLLNPSGKLLISIPNIQHIATFVNIYFKGKWPLNERGIFDKTHMRFFTRKNLLDLVNIPNVQLIEMKRKYRFGDALKYSFFPPYIHYLFPRCLKNIFTFQYILVCQKI
jgi:2-polyprenyl-3-methyl-5-hydroxy-6-metoxy-1,4-benzoquinol methylase